MNPRIQTRSSNHDITVYDTTELYGETGRFRVMQFSNLAIQGAMDLDQPQRILFEYPRAILHLMEWNQPYFEDVFVIGHGIGTIAGHYPEKRFKVAELDAEVVALSKSHFGYSGDNVWIGDGRLLLAQEKPQTYDYIVLDAFTAAGTPRHLVSSEFFSLTREKLASHGALLINLMGKGEHDPLINAIHTTLSEHYGHIEAFCLPSGTAGDLLNILLIASNRPLRFQARQMAGFSGMKPGEGYVIRD
ncbi:spermidine synthase [Paenibacillus donghaensis]|uniref:Spermidine synthase n=1 Tax=Paenibacillus donghaensis TaxID=414771 RepID=A0A2Z2KWN8_9BACL|nr:fused MFS/spermidine synthase [Paenibacillus donghaensis]ASA25901.1 spermidine synthase [Paenibacillus donghaensis]